MSQKFVICVDNRGYPVSLESRKIYEVITDEAAERAGQIRVKDESGEGYVYPRSLFADITPP